VRARGFALLAVLWTLAAVSAAIGGALVLLRDGDGATRNRLLLARGHWAAEACLAITQARWGTSSWADSDVVGLGRRTRCAWHASDPTARLNLNTADRDVLVRLFSAEGLSPAEAAALADAAVARRRVAPFESPEQLRDIAAVPDLSFDELTVDGPGTVNANAAWPAVLGALPGLGSEAVALLLGRRLGGRRLTSLDDLAGSLSPVGRGALLAAYGDLARVLVFSAPQLHVTATGWVEGNAPVLQARIDEMAVPLPTRLAVIRRLLR
jgi:DNA uptake protein ComE-like DNA-binding protein